MSVQTLAADLLRAARAAGADHAEVDVHQVTSLNVAVRNGKAERVERSEATKYGLRVLMRSQKGWQQATVSAADPGAMAEVAERAVTMARHALPDPWVAPMEAEPLQAQCLQLYDPAVASTTAEDLLKLCHSAEGTARATPGITACDAVEAGTTVTESCLADTAGFMGGWHETHIGQSLTAIAGQGLHMERDYAHDSHRTRAALSKPATLGGEAAARALARLKPRQPPSGVFPVVFDNRSSAALIGALLVAINGHTVSRRTGWLADPLGAAVLPAGLSLFDDPLLVAGPATRLFDGEGMQSRRRALVVNGRVESLVLDQASARQLGLPPTGHATRGLGSPPSPASSNVTLVGRGHSLNELLEQMKRGLLVTGGMGGGVNPTTGDYSRAATGFWIEDGEIAFPVNECTIAGHIRTMLASLTKGDDYRPHQRLSVPALLVPKMTLAAK